MLQQYAPQQMGFLDFDTRSTALATLLQTTLPGDQNITQNYNSLYALFQQLRRSLTTLRMQLEGPAGHRYSLPTIRFQYIGNENSALAPQALVCLARPASPGPATATATAQLPSSGPSFSASNKLKIKFKIRSSESTLKTTSPKPPLAAATLPASNRLTIPNSAKLRDYLSPYSSVKPAPLGSATTLPNSSHTHPSSAPRHQFPLARDEDRRRALEAIRRRESIVEQNVGSIQTDTAALPSTIPLHKDVNRKLNKSTGILGKEDRQLGKMPSIPQAGKQELLVTGGNLNQEESEQEFEEEQPKKRRKGKGPRK